MTIYLSAVHAIDIKAVLAAEANFSTAADTDYQRMTIKLAPTELGASGRGLQDSRGPRL